jgi:hypothetical protein
MLANQLGKLRRNPALVTIALAGGIVLGVLAGVLVDRGSDSARAVGGAATTITVGSSRRGIAASRQATRRREAAPVAGIDPRDAAPVAGIRKGSAPTPVRQALQATLNRGVEEAEGLGGEAAAAVWVAGDSHPLLGGPTAVPHRLWSMSKAVVTVAALQAVEDRPDSVLWSAMTDAIRRSDNCAIRRVIVGLQDRVGEGVAGAVTAFEGVLAAAHARIERRPQSAPPEPACVRYLDSHQGGLPSSDRGVAAEFGTAEWTEYDAISFTHALSEGVYGEAGADLLRLMALPKQPPLEEPPPPSAPPLEWGAGAAFPASWKPAWKAGWGGSQDDPPHFLSGQIVVLDLAGVPVAVTAIFVPRTEPATDNPGLTAAPRALELMFAAARTGLEDEHVGGVR